MSIVLATIRAKGDAHLEVEMSCEQYGGLIFLEQGKDVIVLDNAQLQQLWQAIEAEMKRR